jgi:hypothetical protein
VPVIGRYQSGVESSRRIKRRTSHQLSIRRLVFGALIDQPNISCVSEADNDFL